MCLQHIYQSLCLFAINICNFIEGKHDFSISITKLVSSLTLTIQYTDHRLFAILPQSFLDLNHAVLAMRK